MGKRNAQHIGQNDFETPLKRQKVLQSPTSQDSSPKLDFTLTEEITENTVLTDLRLGQWRIGKSIGKYLIIFYYLHSSLFSERID